MQSCKPEQGRARSEEAGWRRGGRMEREKEQFRRMKGMKEGGGSRYTGGEDQVEPVPFNLRSRQPFVQT